MKHFKDWFDFQLHRTLVLMTSDPKVEVFLNKHNFKWFCFPFILAIFKVLTVIMTTHFMSTEKLRP